MSVNRPTIEHLMIACRHVRELMNANVTENLAIRTLEIFTDVYAKMLHGGSASPHHVNQVPLTQWSTKARALRDSGASLAGQLRVEHGTPRRNFARKVLALYESGNLTEAAMDDLSRKLWKLAVITIGEDRALNQSMRSAEFDSPDARWRKAGITFVAD